MKAELKEWDSQMVPESRGSIQVIRHSLRDAAAVENIRSDKILHIKKHN